MNEPLPANSTIPNPDHVRIELARAGYGHVAVYVHDEMGCMIEPEQVPDHVWLDVLRRAGASPLPCLACYQAGEGTVCAGGRCSRPGQSGNRNTGPKRLVLPPGFT